MKPLLDLIKQRRSVRKFKNITLTYIDLLELVEAGIYAPSGSNTQCYRFMIITNEQDIKFLAKMKIPIVKNAPAIILVVADLSVCSYLRSKRATVFDKLPFQDCAMAMQNMCLLAESKGISQCVIHLSDTWYSSTAIKRYFNLENHHELQGMILLGYADETINLTTAKHAGKLIARKPVDSYLIKRNVQ